MRCKSLRIWAVLLLLVACDSDIGNIGNPQPTKPIPEITLIALDGPAANLNAWRGKVLVLNVWATWCPPCRHEIPSLERLSRIDPQRIAVIGMSVDDDRNLLREYLHEYHVTFPIFSDAKMEVARRLEIQAYPETLVISPSGALLARVVGERSWDDAATVEKLRAAYGGKPLKLTP